jgi:hypothetical protein
MAGEYHYSGSKTSLSLDEPLHLTKFMTTWILPPALQPIYGTQLTISDQLKSVGELSLDKLPELVEQMFRGTKRKFVGTVAEDTTVEMEMTFNVNVTKEGVPYPLDVMRDWCKLAYDVQTGLQLLKRDYVGQLTIEVHDKVGTLIRKVFFPVLLPATPPSNFEGLDYNEQKEYEMTITFVGENQTDLLTKKK